MTLARSAMSPAATPVPDRDVTRGPTPLDRLLGVPSSARYDAIDWTTPIDRSRWFLCETQTPMFYARVYQELSLEQRRRYNQLTGMLSNELIGLLETELLASALRTIEARQPSGDALHEAVARFRDDEVRHAETWRRLNLLSEPGWYAAADRRLARVPAAAIACSRMLARRPHAFPVVLWIQLAQEERSVDMSRRALTLPQGRLEPRYAAVFEAHLQDEVRHVQIDWHLIERFYRRRSRLVRAMTAVLFERFVGSVLLLPVYSTTGVVRVLADEFPELRPLVPRMLRELRGLGQSEEYHEMMYSRRTTPLTFALFDGFPEFHRIGRTLRGYRSR